MRGGWIEISLILFGVYLLALLTPTIEPQRGPGQDEPLPLQGTITDRRDLGREDPQSLLGWLLIEEEGSKRYGRGPYHVSVTAGTELWKQDQQQLTEASWGEFQVGRRVEAWLDDKLILTFPPQALARKLVLVERVGQR